MSDEITRRVPQPEGNIPAAAPPPDSPEALVGRTFGQYEILALVSESMALVYRAQQATPRREVALKVPRGLARIPDEVRRRFLREVQLNVGMSHPNIVGVLDAGEVEGVPFYTMPFVEGQRLDRFVEERKPACAGGWACSGGCAKSCRPSIAMVWCTATSSRRTS